jgi:hypothetical protein
MMMHIKCYQNDLLIQTLQISPVHQNSDTKIKQKDLKLHVSNQQSFEPWIVMSIKERR